MILEKFPKLEAKTLAGRKVSFPEVTKGKKSFLVLAFEDKGEYENCQAQADKWARFWETNLKKKDIVFYEVPMMSGKYSWISFWVDSGMRSGIDKAKHDAVACYYGDKEKYITRLGIKNLRNAYVFLLDEEGNILITEDGEINDSKTEKILRAVQ
ncbi:MAG: hypothetical protein SFU98_09710 [Leptospiraceae bacterium]|nr:hypothetical protein [Leptospiraceae bacterium]